jgi:hypothetical protein
MAIFLCGLPIHRSGSNISGYLARVKSIPKSPAGDMTMILFEEGWKEHAVNYLKSEALARGIIKNAAAALSTNHNCQGLMFWIHAAQGGAGILNVLKGPHQPKGVANEVLHLRMRLYIDDNKKGKLKDANTALATDFHLYATILNPGAGPDEYRLQPTKLTYKTAWQKEADFAEVIITGARVLTNNLK